MVFYSSKVGGVSVFRMPLFFLFCWYVAQFGVFDFPSNVSFRNNAFGYASIFVLLSLALHIDDRHLPRAYRWLCVLVAVGTVLAVGSRGVALTCFSLITIFVTAFLVRDRTLILIGSALLLFLLLINIEFLLPLITNIYIHDLIYELKTISHEVENGRKVIGLELLDPNNERGVSSVSRIGTLWVTLVLGLENVVIGVGQQLTYDYRIYGSSIHSFFPLVFASTGLFGLSICFLSLYLVATAKGSVKCTVVNISIVLCFLGIMPLFKNSLPLYMAPLIVGMSFKKNEKSRSSTS